MGISSCFKNHHRSYIEVLPRFRTGSSRRGFDFPHEADSASIWKILHQGVRYEERGPAVSAEAKKVRTRKMIRELRSLGYRVELLPASSKSPA